MRAAASSGPPSPDGKSVGERGPRPEDAGIRQFLSKVKAPSKPVYFYNTLFLRVQLGSVFYNFMGPEERPTGVPSTSVDLTPGASAPMFAAKRPTRISRNRPL